MTTPTLLVATFTDTGVIVEGHCYMQHHFDERFEIVNKVNGEFLVKSIR